MVVPDFPSIKSREDYYYIRNRQLIILLAGPIGSGSLGIILMFLLQLVQKYILISAIKYICCGIAFLIGLHTFAIIQKSFYNSVNGEGDISAYKTILKNESYFTEYLYSYLYLASDFERKNKYSYFLKEKIREILGDVEMILSGTNVYLLDDIVLKTLAGVERGFEREISEILKIIIPELKKLIHSEQEIYSILYFHTILYYAIKEKNYTTAHCLYDYGKENINNMNIKVKEYYIKLIESIIHYCCNKIERKNIYPYEGFEQWSIFTQLYELEEAIIYNSIFDYKQTV